MDANQFTAALNDRLVRYGAAPLPTDRAIAITADPQYLATYDGQVAALVAANLMCRLSPRVALAFDDQSLRRELPWQGQSIHGVSLPVMRALNPYADYQVRALHASDCRLHLGPRGAEVVVHGSGWNAYVGRGPSPLRDSDEPIGIGGALAVVLAAGELFRSRLAPLAATRIANAWDWTNKAVDRRDSPSGVDIGHVFTAGLGSVGSSALYFLSLATRAFEATLVDHDRVKVENLTRSAIFTDHDTGQYKVTAAKEYLGRAGVRRVEVDPVPLHLAALWTERQSGTPDVVVAAANEFNVRYHLEMGFPPLQVYATTGKNWQATLFRHFPLSRTCSLCVFPPQQGTALMTCATGEVALPDERVAADAALPFLSFAAGLMTAAEILKVQLPGYPFGPDRVALLFRSEGQLVAAPLSHRAGCTCEERPQGVWRKMVSGSRYAGVPTEENHR